MAKKKAPKNQQSSNTTATPYGLPDVGSRFSSVTAPRELEDPVKRKKWGLPRLDEPDRTGPYIIELNVLHAGGLAGAANEFQELYKTVVKAESERSLTRISKSYYRCELKEAKWKAIIHADESKKSTERAIYRLWPDFPVSATTDRSVVTVKGDAALRSFDAGGQGIVWAVLDSGVQHL